jgi:hypothetical protein
LIVNESGVNEPNRIKSAFGRKKGLLFIFERLADFRANKKPDQLLVFRVFYLHRILRGGKKANTFAQK